MAHSGKTMTFATDLVPQEDNIYSLGYGNQRWKIYGELQPLVTKTYNAPLYNSSSGANFYQNFATVTPEDYNAIWIAHYRITITASGHSDYTEICDVSISGRNNTWYTYNIYNSIVTYSIYQHMLLNSNSATVPHELGYRMQGSYGADSVAKVVKVELLEQLNCTVALLDNLKLYTSATPSGYTWRGFNATSNGLQETGDNDAYGYYILSNGFKGKAGSNKVYRQCLFARTGDGTYESFVMESNTRATTKTANPHGFVPDGKIYWNSSGSDYSAGTLNISPYEQYHVIDYLYSFNFDNQFLPDYCETYVVYTYNEDDGLLYLDTTQWLAAALPTTEDGKIYQRIGSKYYTGTGNYYQGSLLLDNPYYEYRDGEIRSWSATHLSSITGADDLKAIEAISETTGLLKKTAANTWTLDTSNYVTSSGITSVTIGATSPVQSSTSTAQSGSSASTTISLKDAYGDTKNPYGSKTKNYVLAAPSNANGAPSFRALVAADIPNLSWSKITSDKPTTLSGYGITDAKIASGVITLGSSTITPVTSVNGHSGSSVNVTASDLGLASALKYVGTKSSLPTATDSTTYSTYNNGDVITVSAKEYAYVKGSNAAGSSWVELGDEGSYKLKQTAFTNSTGTADGTNTSTAFIYSFSQDENGAISNIKTRQLPTLTNVSYTATAATDDNEYPILMKNSTGSDTTAAGVRFASGTNQQVTINPSTGTVSTRRLVINNSSSNGTVPDLVFSRTSWSYINIPDNDAAVLAIGRGTGDNASQKLIIQGDGVVRPGSDNTQVLGKSTRRWKEVHGVNFYGTFNGTATYSQGLAKWAISNSDLNNFVSNGALRYSWEGGNNGFNSKPTDVNAFGVIAMKTATNWTGQLLMSTDSEPGLYWRTNLTTETPSYGTWARVWDSSNHRVFYGTCAEAAGTAAKPVVCTDYDEMKVGDIITVKFNNTNTAASPTLNVNGKGSKSVKMAYSGGTADLSSYTQLAGIRTFIYDGTNWILQEGECVKQGVTDTTSDIWRPVMLGAYNSTDVRQAPEQRYAMIHAARNVKYHQATGTLRAPILKTPKLSIEYSFEDKAHIQWNDTDSSIDFIFD